MKLRQIGFKTRSQLEGTASFPSPKAHRLFKGRLLSRQGFSLVEVTLALGVMAVAFSIIFGLLGVGLATFRQSKAVSVSAQIAQQVFSQMQAIPFNTLVGGIAATRTAAASLSSVGYTDSMSVNGNTVSSLYFDEEGNELSSSTGAVYSVNVRVAYPTPILPSTVLSSGTPVLNIDLATIMVQVAFNPGNITQTLDSTDRWQTSSVPTTNYQFFVTRNN